MAGHKTLEEAKTALGAAAMEREAVLAHLERVRVAAIEKDAAEVIERREREIAVRADFEARRAVNAEATLARSRGNPEPRLVEPSPTRNAPRGDP